MQDVPKIVIERLQAAVVAEPHPEPDLLIAFGEQTLAKPEREQVIAHLARCSVCREVIALASPLDEMAGRTASLPVRTGWLSRPSLRWAFVGVGTVAVLTVALLRFDQRQKRYETVVALPPQTAIAESSTRGFPPSSGVPELTPSQGAAASQMQAGQRSRLGQADAAGGRQTVVKSDGNDGNTVSQENVQSQVASTASNQTSDALVQSRVTPGSPYQSSNSADVVKAKPASTAPATAGSHPMMPALPLQTSPSLMMRAAPLWMVTATGELQRSFDAGKTWEPVTIAVANLPAAPAPVFRVVTAIGPEVWAGASGAVLYHSVDSGNRWQQVRASSGGVAATGDIARIEFSDPQNGKFTTSTGELWTTSDNGETWQKLR
jgi:hypothetical protein